MKTEANKSTAAKWRCNGKLDLSVSDEKYNHDDESVSNFESKQQAKPKSEQTAQNAKIDGGFENNRSETSDKNILLSFLGFKSFICHYVHLYNQYTIYIIVSPVSL